MEKNENNTCVICGAIIPEGTLTCPNCENKD
jgi:RNA polymerase subunit RPABC4/transcription elongation factor Spt4